MKKSVSLHHGIYTGKQQEITCACGCGRKKMVRVADIKRGWGKFYSKSCKAKWQENRTGQYSSHLNRNHRNSGYAWDIECDIDYGWDEHK